MKRTLSVLVLFIVSLMAAAQSSSRYTSFLGQSGQVIFFKPKDVPAKDSNLKFEYDMTYVEKNDTMILNFSVFSKDVPAIDGLSIQCGERTAVPLSSKRLYVDMKKKKYEVRMQSAFLYKELRDIFSSDVNPQFIVTVDGKEATFTYNASNWKKEHETLKGIFKLTSLK